MFLLSDEMLKCNQKALMDELNLTFCKLLIARVRLKILHGILLLTFTIRITTQVSD